jgi:beta-1,4-mannosyl-glycoprotein beta-1,4-N-acetylglucosaminyltransferase
MPKVFDTFPFFNELRLLDIRLHELSDVVDYFVLVESDATRRGTKKPLYFAENRDLFEPFLDKIISLTMPYPHLSEKECEIKQRNMILDAIKDKATDDDIIIVSDADEIPRASKIPLLKEMERPVLMQAWLYYYYLNGLAARDYPLAPVACRYGDLLSHYKTCHDLRVGVIYDGKNNGAKRRSTVMKNASWHFSWIGGIDRIIEKARAFHRPDRKWDTSKFLGRERITRMVNEGLHISGRSENRIVYYGSIDGTFPKYLVENQTKFSDMIYMGVN